MPVLWFCLVCVTHAPSASPGLTRSFDASYERSDVKNAGTGAIWEVSGMQLGLLRAAGGLFLSVERHTRDSLDDVVVRANGFRRLGDWTVAGGLSISPQSHFLARTGFDAEASRRLVGTTVASAGYSRLRFPQTAVHQFKPALTWYHDRGELGARVYVTRREAPDSGSATAVLSGYVDLTPGIRLSAAAAAGDRIFDVASLPSAGNRARTITMRLRVGITDRDFLQIGVGTAREAPAFRQRTMNLTYRRLF